MKLHESTSKIHDYKIKLQVLMILLEKWIFTSHCAPSNSGRHLQINFLSRFWDAFEPFVIVSFNLTDKLVATTLFEHDPPFMHGKEAQ